ncbi:sperm equatorial segment protein 1 [Sorex fumeus]|uniref:sperm equatorial segment protein 1 n=1 Tax=Sorex fumeus TaxID=62283 RepID=UPI0024AD0CC1|nr:sperm equatorial segment protein 1 [Sorex fumeus]
MPMKSVVVLAALLLLPSPVPAPRRITVTPDEEQNLNHYVEVLQNMLLSVPTKEITSVKESASSITAQSLNPKISKLNTATRHGDVSTEKEKSTSRHATTPFTPGFPWQTGKKRRKTTAFWSVRPNNVSVVLRTDEPFIEKEEPEPEPEPSSTRSVIESTTIVETVSSGSTLDVDTAAELEDVPQLSGTYMSPESQRLRNEEILKKISDIRSQVRRVPVSESLQPQYRKDIIAAREHLKRSLALAAAAEHRLQKMYESEAIPLGQSSGENGDIETVINVLYNSRSKLSEYFDVKSIPPELRRKATVVINILKKTLCASQVETQSLIKKLLSNNMQILNILDVP